jgi:hypothetical protein
MHFATRNRYGPLLHEVACLRGSWGFTANFAVVSYFTSLVSSVCSTKCSLASLWFPRWSAIFVLYPVLLSGVILIHFTFLQPFKTQWLLCLLCSAFCPQSLLVCFIRFSQEIAIIFLTSINLLLFILRELLCFLWGANWIYKKFNLWMVNKHFIDFVSSFYISCFRSLNQNCVRISIPPVLFTCLFYLKLLRLYPQ